MTQHSDRRRTLQWILTILVLGFAVHILLPQVGEVGQAFRSLRSGRWRYLPVALVGAVMAYVTGGWMVGAATERKLSFTRTVLGQVAASFMATLTPGGIGWVGVTEGYLERSGIDEPTARAATALDMLITFVSHVALLVILLPLLPTLRLPPIHLPTRQVIVEITVVVLVVLGVAFWIPASRRRILAGLMDMMRAVPSVLGSPRRSAIMIGAAVAGNLAFALSLGGSVATYGPIPSWFGILVAYMLAATVAAISPTPGGLGAMETALV
ncbi:MAG: lysylphosphatidylglycerol synthase transmembrane domain-containing protein, partial [Acidimicrobiia bacterium]